MPTLKSILERVYINYYRIFLGIPLGFPAYLMSRNVPCSILVGAPSESFDGIPILTIMLSLYQKFVFFFFREYQLTSKAPTQLKLPTEFYSESSDIQIVSEMLCYITFFFLIRKCATFAKHTSLAVEIENFLLKISNFNFLTLSLD